MQRILSYLPHRYPILMIDRVQECEPRQAHRRAEERLGERAVFPGPLSRPADHARRADPRGDGAGRGDPGRSARRRRADDRLDLLLRRHRRRALQAAGGARRPARARGEARRASCAASASSPAWRASPATWSPRPTILLHHAAGEQMTGVIHPTAIVDAGRAARARRRRSARTRVDRRARSRSARARWIGAHVVHRRPHCASAATTASSTSRRSARRRRTRSTAASPPRSRSATATPSASTCTINRGTVQDAGVTRIGNDNWIMAYVHFAHDCQIGSNTIFANDVQLAGHVHVGDWAILGGITLRAPVRAHRRARVHRHGHRSSAAGPAALRHARRATMAQPLRHQQPRA